jgi:hypothetical protein
MTSPGCRLSPVGGRAVPMATGRGASEARLQDAEVSVRVAVVLPLFVEDHVEAVERRLRVGRVACRIRWNAEPTEFLGR